MIKNICVYCGSSMKVDDSFKQASKNLGDILARENLRLVFGGGRVGLMGIVSSAVLDGAGEVIGIIPKHIIEKEVPHHGLTELHVVETMHERKQMMVDRSDAFVIMPGGLGTMDEFFEIFTWWKLGLHEKPIIIVNVEDYWTPLLEMLNNIIKHGFAREKDRDYLYIIDDVNDIVEVLEKAPQGKSAAGKNGA